MDSELEWFFENEFDEDMKGLECLNDPDNVMEVVMFEETDPFFEVSFHPGQSIVTTEWRGEAKEMEMTFVDDRAVEFGRDSFAISVQRASVHNRLHILVMEGKQKVVDEFCSGMWEVDGDGQHMIAVCE